MSDEQSIFGSISSLADSMVKHCVGRMPYEAVAAAEMVLAWAKANEALAKNLEMQAMQQMAGAALSKSMAGMGGGFEIISAQEVSGNPDNPNGMQNARKPGGGNTAQDKWIAEELKD